MRRLEHSDKTDGFKRLNNGEDACPGDWRFTWRLLAGGIGSDVSEITVVFEDALSLRPSRAPCAFFRPPVACGGGGTLLDHRADGAPAAERDGRDRDGR